jgi:hypothetical protein
MRDLVGDCRIKPAQLSPPCKRAEHRSFGVDERSVEVGQNRKVIHGHGRRLRRAV